MSSALPVPASLAPSGSPLHSLGEAPAPVVVLRVASQSLLAGQREIEIDHDGVIYRLRQTALGKLILTK